MLRKDVYDCEYVDSWKKFDETSILPKEAYYSELNEEGNRDEDYANVQRVWEVFQIKYMGENHDLYVLSDTLLLADVFENFRDKRLQIHELDPA